MEEGNETKSGFHRNWIFSGTEGFLFDWKPPSDREKDPGPWPGQGSFE